MKFYVSLRLEKNGGDDDGETKFGDRRENGPDKVITRFTRETRIRTENVSCVVGLLGKLRIQASIVKRQT